MQQVRVEVNRAFIYFTVIILPCCNEGVKILDASGGLSPAFFAALGMEGVVQATVFPDAGLSNGGTDVICTHLWHMLLDDVAANLVKTKTKLRVLHAICPEELECFSEIYGSACDQNNEDMVSECLDKECKKYDVFVDNSRIPNSGKGLFAAKFLSKGTVLPYFGRCIYKDSRTGCSGRYAELDVVLPTKPDAVVCVNGCRTSPATYAQHVNAEEDSKHFNAKLVCNYLWQGSSQPNSTYNVTSKFIPALKLVLTKDVKCLKEICTDYGGGYWEEEGLVPDGYPQSDGEDSDDDEEDSEEDERQVGKKDKRKPVDGEEEGKNDGGEEGEWVQCDFKKCKKWRRLPKGVTASTLPNKWYDKRITGMI